jgi:hypothetical protein
MVPPGLHLTLAGGSGNEATRIAEFHWIAPSEAGLVAVAYMGVDTTFHSVMDHFCCPLKTRFSGDSRAGPVAV